jgi:hypothetical protein
MSHRRNLYSYHDDDYFKTPQQRASEAANKAQADAEMDFEYNTWPRLQQKMDAGLTLTKYELYDTRMFGGPLHRTKIFAYVRAQQNADKLSVAAADSAEEKQADAVANAVATGGEVQTTSTASGKTESSSLTVSPEFEEKLLAGKGQGEPLNSALRGEMESKMNGDFGDVRVHTGADAAEMSAEINARAFTHGKDVYLGSGESVEDKELMAHELVHTITPGNIIKRKGINDPLNYGLHPEVKPNFLKGKTLLMDADGDGYQELELVLYLDKDKVLQLQVHHLDSDVWTNRQHFQSDKEALVVLNFQTLGAAHKTSKFTPNDTELNTNYINQFKLYDEVDPDKKSYQLNFGADVNFRQNGQYHAALGPHKITFTVNPSKIKKRSEDISFTETRKAEALSGPIYTFQAGQQGDEIELQIQQDFEAAIPQEMIAQNRTSAYSIYGYMKRLNGKIVRWTEPVMVYAVNNQMPASLNPVYQDEKLIELGISGSFLPDITIHYYTLSEKNKFYHNRKIQLHFSGPALFGGKDFRSFILVNNFPVANSNFRGEDDYHSLLDYEAPAMLNNQGKPLSVEEDIAKTEAILLQLMQRLVLDGSMNEMVFLSWKEYLLSRTVLEVVKNAKVNSEEEKAQRNSIIFNAAMKADAFAYQLMRETKAYGYVLSNSYPSKTIIVGNWSKEEKEFEELHALLDNYVLNIASRNTGNTPPDYIHDITSSPSAQPYSVQYRLPTEEEFTAYEKSKKQETDSIRTNLRNEAKAEGLNEAQQHDKLVGSYSHFATYRNQLKEIEKKQYLQKINAVFYGTTPEHINQFNTSSSTNAVAVPLPIWVYVENNEWHIVDLINPQQPFKAAVPYYSENGSNPPEALFEQLNHEKHLPKGYIYYQIGDQKKVVITQGEQTQWYDILGYIALGLGFVGLSIATFGAALPAKIAVLGTVVSYASIITGALSTAGDMWDSYKHGQLTDQTLMLNMLDLAGALLQLKTLSISLLLRSETMAAKLPKALQAAKLVYMPLKIGEYATEGTRLFIITADAAEQITQIINAPGDDEAKKRALVTLLSQMALSLSMYVLDVKDYGDEVNLVRNAGKKSGATTHSPHTEPDINIKINELSGNENVGKSVVEAAGETQEEILGGDSETPVTTAQQRVTYGKDEKGFYRTNLDQPHIQQRITEAEFYNARVSIANAQVKKTGKIENPAKVSVDALLLLVAFADLQIQAVNYPAGILAGVSTATLLLRKGMRGMIGKLKAKNPGISDKELLDELKKTIHSDGELNRSLKEKNFNSIDEVDFEMPDGSKKKFDEIAQEEIDHSKLPDEERKKIEAEQEAELKPEQKEKITTEDETVKPKEETPEIKPEITSEKKIEYWAEDQLTHVPGNPEYLKIMLNGDPKQIITLKREKDKDWIVQRGTKEANDNNKLTNEEILERVPEKYRKKSETINPNEDVTQNTSNEVENKKSEIQKDNSEKLTSKKAETGEPPFAKRKTILKVGEPILNGKINRVRAGDEKKIVIIGLDMNGHVIPIAKELQSQGFDVEILEDNFLNGRTFEIDGKQWTVTEAFNDMVENDKYDGMRGLDNKILPEFLDQIPMYKLNEQWITEHKTSGKTILDVGGPANSNKTSTFYNMEINSINWNTQ